MKRERQFLKSRRGIVGLEAAIVLIAFVIVAAAFSFMVVNQGLFATQRGRVVIQEGLKQASTPLTIDGSVIVRTTTDGKAVGVIIVPVKAFGVKYVAMWKNGTVITMKLGRDAYANIYGGVMYTKDVKVERELTGHAALPIALFTLTNWPVVPGSDRVYIEDTFTGIVAGEKVFTLGNPPKAYSERVYVNDVLQRRSIDLDYTIADKIITFTTPKIDTDNIIVDYETTYTYTIAGQDITFGMDIAASSDVNAVSTEVYADYSYIDTEEHGTCDPSGKKFDALVGIVYDTESKHYNNGVYVDGASETVAVLAIENSNGDEALDTFEKGYLIIVLSGEDAVSSRALINIEIRLEKTATLSMEFSIPESMPKNTYVICQ